MPRPRPRAIAWSLSAVALIALVAVSIGTTFDLRPGPDEPAASPAASAAPVSTPAADQSKSSNAPPPQAPLVPEPPPDVRAIIEWRDSTSLGLPMAGGRLVRGVQLPSSGPGFSTWDPVLKRVPNRHWRRWGHDEVVRTLLDIVDRYREEFPKAPPLLIGDLSRPRGGDFGPQWGSLGHASHQNGLDVDVYYPRTDRKLVRPETPEQVNPRIAQWLVDQFVAEKPEFVFTGPSLNLKGPAGIVAPLANHDDHLHIRFHNPDG